MAEYLIPDEWEGELHEAALEVFMPGILERVGMSGAELTEARHRAEVLLDRELRRDLEEVARG